MDDEPVTPRERPRDHVTSTLAKRILSGALEPGERLPTEAELTEELAVSRTALRESMRTLAGKGLISTRTRAGSVVQPAARWNNLDPELLAWREELAPDVGFLQALTEARAVIEPAAAALAAERATPRDHGRIAEAFDAMQDAARQDDLESSVAADEAFHLAIVASSGNIVFVNFGALIGSALRQSFRLTTSAAISYDQALEIHGAVLQAIRKGRPDAAQAAMTRLIAIASADMQRALMTED
jgi:DNA-binding FadR family transcriptional regulator